MPQNAIQDRKNRLEVSKPIKLTPGSYLDPTEGGPSVFEDFIRPVSSTFESEGSNINILQSGTPSVVAALLATAGAPVAGHGGWLSGSVDNVDGEIDEVFWGNFLFPNALPTGGLIVAELGFVLNALTARIMFFGLSGGVTNAGADGPLSITTGTTLVDGSTAGDAAGFVLSSLATDTDNFYSGVTKATTVGTAYNTSAGTQGPAMDASTADDYTRLRVEVDVDGDCFFYGGISTSLARGAVPLVFRNSVAAGITAAEGYAPFHSMASTETTAVIWELDYIFGAATHA